MMGNVTPSWRSQTNVVFVRQSNSDNQLAKKDENNREFTCLHQKHYCFSAGSQVLEYGVRPLQILASAQPILSDALQ